MWMQGTRNTASIRAQYNFASDMIKNLIHVKVFYIEDIDIHYISQDIAKLSKLEILILSNNQRNLYLPFDDSVCHLCMIYQCSFCMQIITLVFC